MTVWRNCVELRPFYSVWPVECCLSSLGIGEDLWTGHPIRVSFCSNFLPIEIWLQALVLANSNNGVPLQWDGHMINCSITPHRLISLPRGFALHYCYCPNRTRVACIQFHQQPEITSLFILVSAFNSTNWPQRQRPESKEIAPFLLWRGNRCEAGALRRARCSNIHEILPCFTAVSTDFSGMETKNGRKYGRK